MSTEIMVSILCLAYNHGKYIKQALDSILSQKTNFEFEILIHDDASTDETAGIIREYEKKYPKIIKPIYQIENQGSKIEKITETFQIPRISGKYVAYCECDDFWNNQNKLQLQYNFMESHSEYSMCCHAADIVDENGNHIRVQRPFHKNCIIDIRNILWNKYDYIPTASMFAKSSIVKNSKPEFYKIAPVGDLPTQMLLALNGPMYYFDCAMSGYRTNVGVSWTNRMLSNPEKRERFRKRLIRMYDEFDANTNYKYTQDVLIAKQRPSFEDALAARDLRKLKSDLLKYHYKRLPLKTRISLNMRSFWRANSIK